MDEWAASRTETELKGQISGLSAILDQITLQTYEIANENLKPEDGLAVIGAILPILMHACNYSAHNKSHLQIDHMSAELEKARDSMDRLDKNKSDFIAIAAHELKTPLTLIEGYSAMLKERLQPLDGVNQAEILLKGIDNGTRRLEEIIDDMIDVSMIDNDLLALNFQPVWINRLLDGVHREFKQIIHDRRLNLDVRSFAGSQEMIFGDEERLYQAFRNLVSNAIKYTPDGGSIIIDGRLLPGFIEILITDTGIGIALEDQERIFEKFGRLGSVSLHSSGKTKFKGGGPGLGLAISRGIIEAHGGTIWVESEGYDEIRCPGATFHLLLPLRKSPPDKKIARLFHASVGTDNSEDIF